jgi:hypothetical protein
LNKLEILALEGAKYVSSIADPTPRVFKGTKANKNWCLSFFIFPFSFFVLLCFLAVFSSINLVEYSKHATFVEYEKISAEQRSLCSPDNVEWIPTEEKLRKRTSDSNEVTHQEIKELQEELELFSRDFPSELQPTIKKAKFARPNEWLSNDMGALLEKQSTFAELTETVKTVPKLFEEAIKIGREVTSILFRHYFVFLISYFSSFFKGTT